MTKHKLDYPTFCQKNKNKLNEGKYTIYLQEARKRTPLESGRYFILFFWRNKIILK